MKPVNAEGDVWEPEASVFEKQTDPHVDLKDLPRVRPSRSLSTLLYVALLYLT